MNVDYEVQTFYFSKFIDGKEVTVEVEYTFMEGTIVVLSHNVYYGEIPLEVIVSEEEIIREIEIMLEVGYDIR